MRKILGILVVVIAVMLLMGLRKSEPTEWREYKVRSGDTVSSIAVKITPNSEDYRESMYYMAEKNEIENGMISPGQVILVPVVEGE